MSRRLSSILICFCLATTALAFSSPAAAVVRVFGAPKAFGEADAAWHKGDLEKAQSLYEGALKKGGLNPKEVVIAYSRIGTVKAALRDKQGALSDFRVAAVIDPEFELPADSGPAAKKLYSQAVKEAASQGEKLSLEVKAPRKVKAGKGFSVQAKIPAGFSVFVTRIVVTVEDTLTGKRWKKSADSGDDVDISFPGKVAEPGAKLKLTVSGVDGLKNAWVQQVTKIKVRGSRKKAGGGAAAWGGDSKSDDPFADSPKNDPAMDDEGGGGLFSGPTPWIIGGVAAIVLIGGGIFLATRSSSEANVGAPAWQ